MDNAPNGDGVVAFFIGHNQRLFGDPADAHDRRIGLIDDWESEDGTELAGVGDGEGGTFNVFGLEFFAAGAFAEIGDTALQTEKIQVTGVLENGDDESPIERDGDADVDVAMIADAVAFE